MKKVSCSGLLNRICFKNNMYIRCMIVNTEQYKTPTVSQNENNFEMDEYLRFALNCVDLKMIM